MSDLGVVGVMGAIVAVIVYFACRDRKPKFKVGDIIQREDMEEWEHDEKEVLRVGKYKYLVKSIGGGSSFEYSKGIVNTDILYKKVRSDEQQ